MNFGKKRVWNLSGHTSTYLPPTWILIVFPRLRSGCGCGCGCISLPSVFQQYAAWIYTKLFRSTFCLHPCVTVCLLKCICRYAHPHVQDHRPNGCGSYVAPPPPRATPEQAENCSKRGSGGLMALCMFSQRGGEQQVLYGLEVHSRDARRRKQSSQGGRSLLMMLTHLEDSHGSRRLPFARPVVVFASIFVEWSCPILLHSS
jgi:hypothetical protein